MLDRSVSLQPELTKNKSSSGSTGKLKPPIVTPTGKLRKMLSGEGKRLTILPELRKDPWKWGLAAKKVSRLYDHIKDDINGYARDHCLDNQFCHRCKVSPCPWEHDGASHAPVDLSACVERCLVACMHLVVQRYIRPWTAPYAVSYSAMLLAEEAAQKLHTNNTLTKACATEVFISHCWNEPFTDFTSTLNNSLDPETIIWVCSFGIDQNRNIAGEIGGDLLSCPFARALDGASRVLVVMDSKVEPLERVWCVLEAHLAFMWNKPYHFALPNELQEAAWTSVDEKLSTLDVRECKATDATDKERILDFVAKEGGGIEKLNCNVRAVSAAAAEQASVFSSAANGQSNALSEVNISLLGRTNSRNRLPMHIAAEHGHVAVVVFLLKRLDGSLFDAEDCDGRTPLSVACEAGATNVATVLIDFKADLQKACHSEGKRSLMRSSAPFHFAAARGHESTISFLVDARAELHSKNGGGYTAVHLAAIHYHSKATSLLLQLRADVSLPCVSGFTALHNIDTKASDEAVDIMKILFLHRASLNAMTNDGRTPVFVAAQAGRNRALSLLLEASADVEMSTSRGFAPLHVAAEKGNVQCIRILVGAGANIDKFTNIGSTPLKVAVANARKNTVGCLLELRASVDKHAGDSSTPLHVAASKGLTEMAKLLLRHGASLEERNVDGHRPWFVAASNKHASTLALLLEHAFAFSNPLDCKEIAFIEALAEFLATAMVVFGGDSGVKEACCRIADEFEQSTSISCVILEYASESVDPEEILQLVNACLEIEGYERGKGLLERATHSLKVQPSLLRVASSNGSRESAIGIKENRGETTACVDEY